MKSFKLAYKYVAIIAIVFTILLGFSTAAGASGTFNRVPFGNRSYSIFVPSGYTPGEAIPLVVMLHGCSQNPNDFALGTQMNQIAEQENFIVIYPEQTSAANISRCWNFFEPANQRRGSGEPQIIVDMVNEVKSNFSIDSDSVFAAGLSAGGAMTTTLGVLYPDVFTAVSVNAGLAFQSGTNSMNVWQAMNPGTPATNPTVAADNAFNQVPAAGRRIVPTIVFHGTTDNTVRPLAGEHVVTQMLAYNARIDASISSANQATQTGSANGLSYSLNTFTNGAGDTIVQHYIITGLGHFWSGGNSAGSHTSASGPNASLISWRFFQEAAGIERDNNGNENGNGDVENDDNENVGDNDIDNDNNDTTPENPVEYIVATGTVNDHFLTGRIDVNEFLRLSQIHGFLNRFNLYQVVGTDTWTEIRPDGGGHPTPTPPPVEPSPEPTPTPPPVEPNPEPTPTPPPVEPNPAPESVTATIVQHFNAGRLNLNQYLTLGGRYGFNTIITLYYIDGAWVMQ